MTRRKNGAGSRAKAEKEGDREERRESWSGGGELREDFLPRRILIRRTMRALTKSDGRRDTSRWEKKWRITSSESGGQVVSKKQNSSQKPKGRRRSWRDTI